MPQALHVPSRRPARASAFLEPQPKWVVALVATLVHGVLYLLPNHLRLGAARLLPLTTFDEAVPFWPITAWVYWTDYVLVFVAFQRCRAPGTTTRFVHALATVVVIGTATHWLWPTAYPRHLYLDLSGADPLTGFLFARFREADSPASCFPSLHVAASYLAAFAVLDQGWKRAVPLLVWATAILAATLTTKQHYLVDGLAGLALAALVWRLWSRWLPALARGRRRRPAC